MIDANFAASANLVCVHVKILRSRDHPHCQPGLESPSWFRFGGRIPSLVRNRGSAPARDRPSRFVSPASPVARRARPKTRDSRPPAPIRRHVRAPALRAWQRVFFARRGRRRRRRRGRLRRRRRSGRLRTRRLRGMRRRRRGRWRRRRRRGRLQRKLRGRRRRRRLRICGGVWRWRAWTRKNTRRHTAPFATPISYIDSDKGRYPAEGNAPRPWDAVVAPFRVPHTRALQNLPSLVQRTTVTNHRHCQPGGPAGWIPHLG